LWSGLRSGLPAIALAQARRAGCRATKSRRSRSESAKLSAATGLPAVFLEGLPWASIGVTDHEWFGFLSQQPGIDEVNFWQRM